MQSKFGDSLKRIREKKISALYRWLNDELSQEEEGLAVISEIKEDLEELNVILNEMFSIVKEIENTDKQYIVHLESKYLEAINDYNIIDINYIAHSMYEIAMAHSYKVVKIEDLYQKFLINVRVTLVSYLDYRDMKYKEIRDVLTEEIRLESEIKKAEIFEIWMEDEFRKTLK